MGTRNKYSQEVRERAVQEDDFDALMQAAGLVRMVHSGTPLSSRLTDSTWEGGILGTGGLLLREPAPVRARPARAQRPRSKSRSSAVSPKQRPIEDARRCSGRDDRAGTHTLDRRRCTRTGSRLFSRQRRGEAPLEGSSLGGSTADRSDCAIDGTSASCFRHRPHRFIDLQEER